MSAMRKLARRLCPCCVPEELAPLHVSHTYGISNSDKPMSRARTAAQIAAEAALAQDWCLQNLSATDGSLAPAPPDCGSREPPPRPPRRKAASDRLAEADGADSAAFAPVRHSHMPIRRVVLRTGGHFLSAAGRRGGRARARGGDQRAPGALLQRSVASPRGVSAGPSARTLQPRGSAKSAKSAERCGHFPTGRAGPRGAARRRTRRG